MTTIIMVIQIAITLLLVARMVIVGWFQPPGKIFSWPMFTRAVFVIADLNLRSSDGTEQPIDIYSLRSEHLAQMNQQEFARALIYLRAKHGAKIYGTAVVLDASGTSVLQVAGTRVVD